MRTKYIHARIITCNDKFEIIENGMLIVNDDKIEYLGDITDASTDKTVDCAGCTLLPGLINGCVQFGEYVLPSKTHSLSNLDSDFAFQRQAFSKNDIQKQVEECLVKGLEEGVTTLFDYSGFSNVTAPIFKQVGVRHFGGVGIFEKGQLVTKEDIQKECRQLSKYNTTPFVYSEETFTLTDEKLLPLISFAKQHDVHVPLHRSLVEVGDCVKLSGLSPVAFISDVGILEYPTKLLYGTNMDKEDMSVLRDKETLMTLCPQEDMYLGYGQAPVISYLRQGIKLGVGTGKDSITHASFSQALGAVVMLGASQFHDPNILNEKDMLSMCTTNYQKYAIGVLQKGFFADILFVDKKDFLSSKEDLLAIKHYLKGVMISGKMVYRKK